MELYFKLPYITPHLPGIGGKIRELSEDFIVEEIPAYKPLGFGEHLFVNLTRKEMNTREVALQLARLFHKPLEAIGYAGLKDKYSEATQTFSIHIGNDKPGTLSDMMEVINACLPVRVNWVDLHPRKIRMGQLTQNSFTINITNLDINIKEAVLKAEETSRYLKENGLPNFYGPQRVDEENVRRGREIIFGVRRVKNWWLRRFLVNSYLNFLCNFYLVERISRGYFPRLIRGDVAKKYATGGMFIVNDVDVEQARYMAHEISFTAPIFGPKMWKAEGPSARLENEVLEKTNISIEDLANLRVRGSRRFGRLIPDIRVEPMNRGIRLHFNLPKGAYASIVLREIMKNDR